jgi:predicted SnoaL-like aldol condensation-catalyzing enzyme
MSSTPQSLTALEQNKLLVLRWFEEVWNQGRTETIHELFPEGSILHDGATTLRGPDEFLRFHDALRAQFSNFRITPIISLAEGDRVCLHWTAAFRHTPTSKPMQITGTSVVRIKDGHFAEAWQNWDAASLHTQLTGQQLLSFP